METRTKVMIGLAAVASVGAAVLGRHVARGRKRSELRGAEIINRSHAHKVIELELEEAAERATRAGAEGTLEYQGAGASGIVFCDEHKTAYKVARRGRQDSVREEAEWMRKAGQIPGVREHVARGVRWDNENHVLVRECVKGTTGAWKDSTKLHKIHQSIRTGMTPYGWYAPEFKEDSYVFARGRGPILIDASMAIRVGGELVRYTQDVIEGRRPKTERLEDIAFAVRSERGRSIPAPVADKLLAKLRARGVDTDF